MALSRDQVRPVELPQECRVVDEIGGEVIVRGFDMSQMLRFHAARRESFERLKAEAPEQAQERAAGELVPLALHLAVVLDDGQPVYTEPQWRAFGAQHPAVAMELFGVVMALSGADPASEKKD